MNSFADYLKNGPQAHEPTGDGGYVVPGHIADEIIARNTIQSRWLNFLRTIWWKLFPPKRNVVVIELWDEYDDEALGDE